MEDGIGVYLISRILIGVNVNWGIALPQTLVVRFPTERWWQQILSDQPSESWISIGIGVINEEAVMLLVFVLNPIDFHLDKVVHVSCKIVVTTTSLHLQAVCQHHLLLDLPKSSPNFLESTDSPVDLSYECSCCE